MGYNNIFFKYIQQPHPAWLMTGPCSHILYKEIYLTALLADKRSDVAQWCHVHIEHNLESWFTTTSAIK